MTESVFMEMKKKKIVAILISRAPNRIKNVCIPLEMLSLIIILLNVIKITLTPMLYDVMPGMCRFLIPTERQI
jgi:hypothetical protein